MKKPVEAIKRWRDGKAGNLDEAAIIAYLDSIPEWPADLTRERLEELASEDYSSWFDRSDAIRRLAAIAPKRGKRKVELWKHESWTSSANPIALYAGQCAITDGVDGWRKVWEAEIDA